MEVHYLKLREGQLRDVVGVHVENDTYSHLLFIVAGSGQIAFVPFIEFAEDPTMPVDLTGEYIVKAKAQEVVADVVLDYLQKQGQVIVTPSKKLIV